MTDKEIIIDMRKCEHFGIRTSNGKQFGWCHYYDEHCKDYPNCYFKQLKRKEQECEKLKAIVTEAEEAPICFHCSEEPCIRQERDKYKKLSVVFKDVNKQLGYKYITLKQALEEIEARIQLENADDCLLDVMEIIENVKGR